MTEMTDKDLDAAIKAAVERPGQAPEEIISVAEAERRGLLNYKDKQKHEAKGFCRRAKPGHVPNPLLAYPRNSPCLCGSNKKWKKCCGPDQPPFIAKEDLEDHKKALRGESIDLG